MLKLLKHFYEILVANLTSYNQKSAAQEAVIFSLTDQLQAMTVERDALLEEQREAIKLIDVMSTTLHKQ